MMDSRLEGASFSAALVIALFSTIDFLRWFVPEEDFEEAGEHIWPPIQYVPNLRGNMGSDEYLWADIPYHLIRKYVTDPSAKERALSLISQGRCGGTFRGAGEKDPRRKLQNLKAELRSIRNYHKYFVPKDQ